MLTGGGHNSSVVSPPSKAGAYYYVGDQTGKPCEEPGLWLKNAARHDGSWWPEWMSWLEARSEPGAVPPPRMGAPERGLTPLEPAPGLYVHET